MPAEIAATRVIEFVSERRSKRPLEWSDTSVGRRSVQWSGRASQRRGGALRTKQLPYLSVHSGRCQECPAPTRPGPAHSNDQDASVIELYRTARVAYAAPVASDFRDKRLVRGSISAYRSGALQVRMKLGRLTMTPAFGKAIGTRKLAKPARRRIPR